VYPETVTGRFISLADFENVPGEPPGRAQIEHFTIIGDPQQGRTEFALNITRTGAGAMRVLLPRGAQLVYDIPHVQDFTGYTLLQASVYTDAPRDDLRVTLVSDTGQWSSPRKLLTGDWTTVLVDVQHLADEADFDIRNVEQIVFWLASPSGQLEMYVDDILLVDNRRPLRPTPRGISARIRGLELSLALPHWPEPLQLSPGPDGLWRFEQHQVHLALTGERADQKPAGALDAMGTVRIGRMEWLERNDVRLRLATTWYFPSRLGEWVSLGIRQIRWEHTLYPDGRWVVSMRLNNAGGPEVRSLTLRCPRAAAWAQPDRIGLAATSGVQSLSGPIWRCAMQMVGPGVDEEASLQQAYLRPGRVRLLLGSKAFFAPGDGDKDRYDESQGCYHLRAEDGYCRFVIEPAAAQVHPVVVIRDAQTGPITLSAGGMAIRDYHRTEQGHVILRLPGRLTRPTTVELGPVR
jgi:hypothetical protein